MATYPPRGQNLWDDDLKAYIDEGDSNNASSVAAHEGSTTDVHGIANTAQLETQAGAQAKADGAEAAAKQYSGGMYLPASTVEEALDSLDVRSGGLNTSGVAADLNELVQTGVWYRSGSAPNTPINGAGMVEVQAGGQTVFQRYTVTSQAAYGARVFLRSSQDGGSTWSPWREQVAFGTAVAGGTIPITGNPNGVVSAPVGTRAVNTEAGGWNGARVWRKDSGTGSTGWVVESGDTGWRDIGGLPATAENWTVTSLFIRRVGEMVELAIRGLSGPTTSSSQVFMTVPSGFRSFVPVGFIISGGGSVTTTSILKARVSGMYVWAGNSNLNNITNAEGTLVYFTSDPWPSSLPGTPA